jgi:polyphosphate kinase
VFLSTIVEAYVAKLFGGMRMRGCYQFRVTRNSDLFVEQEEVDDLLRAVEGELASRRYGDAVRLETAHDCPEEILAYLLEQFGLTADDLYKVPGPVNLNRLMAVYDLVDRAELKYAAFLPTHFKASGRSPISSSRRRAIRRCLPSSKPCIASAAIPPSSARWSKPRRQARTSR